jgi:hypothetical protein
LTNYQDLRLHRQLDRAAYHDALEHETAHATRAYSPQYNMQSYGSVPPYGYGAQFRSSQYGATPYGAASYGAPTYQPYSNQSRLGCSPYARY